MKDRKRETETMARYRAAIHARGLCIRCRKPLEPERAHYLECAACMEITRRNTGARRKELIARGLCIDCGKNAAQAGHLRCFGCARRRAEWQEKRRNGEK